MMGWRKRRDNGRAFVVRPKGGKSMSQMLNKQKSEPLTHSELKKILQDRKIDEKEIIPEEEIKRAQSVGESIEGRMISLHPNDSQLDNIFVHEDSPHIFDELDMNKSLEQREQQNRMVAESQGIEIQEDIDKMRDKDNEEKQLEK